MRKTGMFVQVYEKLLLDCLKYLLTIWKIIQNTYFNNQILSLYL